MFVNLKFLVVGIALLGLMLPGCFGNGGLQLVPVSGTVTLDGKPLEGVMVSFYPTGDGNPSMGQTDHSGNYTLKYTWDKSGVMPGEYIVRIVTLTNIDTGKPIGTVVPPQYNEESTLTATIKDSSQTLDFDLTTSK